MAMVAAATSTSLKSALVGACLLGGVCMTLAGCADPASPPSPLDDEQVALVVLRAAPEEARGPGVLKIGVESGAVVGGSDSGLAGLVGWGLSPDGGSLYAIGNAGSSWRSSEVVELDASTGDAAWRQPLADSSFLDGFGWVSVRSSHEFEVSPEGSHVFVGNARSRFGPGVGVVDVETGEVTSFLGPFGDWVTLGVVPPGATGPDGALAVAVSGNAKTGPSLVFYEAGSLEVLREVPVADLFGGADEPAAIVNLQPSPDGSSMYLRSSRGVVAKLNLRTWTVDARVASSAPICEWCLSVAPDGSRVFLAHTHTHASGSSGLIEVFDDDLARQDAIDLGSLRFNSYRGAWSDPPALNGVAVAEDGTLLVAVGAMGLHLWGSQQGRILFLDPETHAVERILELQSGVAAIEILMPAGG